MLVLWFSNLYFQSVFDSVMGGDIEIIQFFGVFNNKEFGMKDIQFELVEVRDVFKIKSDKLEELDGKVKGYEGQFKQFQEVVQGLTVIMTINEFY